MKWEREQVGKESGERRGGYLRCGKWECRKNSPKTQKIWHLGTPLEAKAIAPCHTFLDSSFQGQYFRRSLCHYLEPFKSNRASNLTILQKSPQKFNVFEITADNPGGYRPMPYIFRKIFSRATFASQIVCLSILHRLEVIKLQR